VPNASEALVEAGHPRRLPAHPLHVLRRRPDVLRGDVAAAELVDGPPERPQHRLVAPLPRLEQHDGLAATLVEPRGGGLQRHRLREAEDVDERGLLVGIGPEPHAAERRPERRRVDGDDGPQPDIGLGDEDDLLVARGGHPLQRPGHDARV
jgi:hypothetical protein